MELTFTELHQNDDNNNQISQNQHVKNDILSSVNVESNNQKYWETNNTGIKKKKKVTYDDILTSLNLVVAPNGVLQYMSTTSDTFNQNEIGNDQPQFKPKSILKNTTVQEKIEPQVKHSYIFNKYFKNYKDPNAIQEPRRPMTRQEYQKMLLDDLVKRKLANKRIAQIKSKKLSFTNNNSAPIYASQNNLNHLFRF